MMSDCHDDHATFITDLTDSYTPRPEPLLWRRMSLIVGLAWVLGCQSELPTAPSELMTGIVIYEHANYAGQSAHVTRHVDHLEGFRGPCVKTTGGTGPGDRPDRTESWDDCISSIRVAPGMSAILYRDGYHDGDELRVTEDIPNLQTVAGKCDHGGFNDCASSIRLVPR